MRKELKSALRAECEVPEPLRKKEFLHRMEKLGYLKELKTPSMSCFAFVGIQMAYIRKWIWAVSAVVFAAAFFGAEFLEKDILWCVSAFMPLLAVTVITESGRSGTYGMAEFELSTRFSLKSVVLARMGILGAADFVLVCLLIPLTFRNGKAGIFQTGVYMLCPYLLTAFSGLWIFRRMHGKEAVYLCAALAMGVSVGISLLYQVFPLLYEERKFVWWLAALIFLIVGTAKQCCRMVRQTEELAWS